MNNIFETYCSSFLIMVSDPKMHGYTHDYIKTALHSCRLSDHMAYYCMCDEVMKSTETLHTHVYVTFEYSVPSSVLVFLLPFAHVDCAEASAWEIKNYILKEKNYKPIRAYEEPLEDTFEEWRKQH